MALPEAVESALGELTGETAAWPMDYEFGKAWMSGAAHETMNRAKLTHILARLSTTYLTNKTTEELAIDSELTVEHIMQQNWLGQLALARWIEGDGLERAR